MGEEGFYADPHITHEQNAGWHLIGGNDLLYFAIGAIFFGGYTARNPKNLHFMRVNLIIVRRSGRYV
jgi:hypothetical protein